MRRRPVIEHRSTPARQHPVELDEVQVQRLWRGVQSRRARQDERLRQRPVRRVAAGALAVALGLLALLVWRGPVDSPHEVGPVLAVGGAEAPTHLEAAGEAPVAVPLSDGSRLTLEPGAKLEVLENSGRTFTTALRGGRTRFDVRPGGPRRWKVEAGPVAVEVVGTVFAVERSASAVVVEVEHGVVLVRGEGVPDHVRRLTAGERLTLALPSSRTMHPPAAPSMDGHVTAPPEPPPEAGLAPPPSGVEDAGVAVSPALSQAWPREDGAPVEREPVRGAAVKRSGPRAEKVARGLRSRREPPAEPPSSVAAMESGATRPEPPACGTGLGAAPCLAAAPDEARSEVASAPGGVAPPPPAPPEPWVTAARRGDLRSAYALLGADGVSGEAVRASGLERLMLLADVARAGGHAPLAAQLLERAVREEGSGAAAALAAFQLGTLRLEALGQPREAAEAFRRVVRIGQPRALVEDALARQVQALARAGEWEAARQAAADYEARFPEGRRLADVHRWAGE